MKFFNVSKMLFSTLALFVGLSATSVVLTGCGDDNAVEEAAEEVEDEVDDAT